MKFPAIIEPGSPVDRKLVMRKVKRFLKWVLAGFLIISGIHHLMLTAADDVMLSPARWPLALIYLSGAFELMLGALLVSRRTQVAAAWGIIALLIALSPAHILLAIDADPDEVTFVEQWSRVTAQFLLIGWAFWFTRARRKKRTSAGGGGRSGLIVAPKMALAMPGVSGASAAPAGAALHAQAYTETASSGPDLELGTVTVPRTASTARKRAVSKRRKKPAAAKLEAPDE
jgi:uncharacterized membrane protein